MPGAVLKLYLEAPQLEHKFPENWESDILVGPIPGNLTKGRTMGRAKQWTL